MNAAQLMILDKIRGELARSITRKPQAAVATFALLINHHRDAQAVVPESCVPSLAESIALWLSCTQWESPVTTSVQTGDGVTHILKTVGGRSRPAAQ